MEAIGWSKTSNTQGEKHPATGVGGFGRILCQLFADLRINLIPNRVFCYSIKYGEQKQDMLENYLNSGRRMP